MREINNSVDTVNAAASAIISAESRVQQVTLPRKRWVGFLRVYWCFGSQKNEKRINHAALVPEPTPEASSTSQNPNLTHTLSLPFIAPPSSPASFLTSEPHSSTQSPVGFLSHSPTPRPSIFTIGPYANETQLVSPPVFSAFTTEPNTAPFTPPPESVQLTTPSSPEVPFAQLLSSSFDSNCNKRGEANDYSTYQWYPGSPIGRLISPSSLPSGTSSPFPDLELHSRKHGSILDGQIPAIVVPEPSSGNNSNNANSRVSFELTAEEVARALQSSYSDAEIGHNGEAAIKEMFPDESKQEEAIEKIESSGELNASKEFKFDNSDGVTAETVPPKNWAFFPAVHTETIVKMKMQI